MIILYFLIVKEILASIGFRSFWKNGSDNKARFLLFIQLEVSGISP